MQKQHHYQVLLVTFYSVWYSYYTFKISIPIYVETFFFDTSYITNNDVIAKTQK